MIDSISTLEAAIAGALLIYFLLRLLDDILR